MLTGLSVLLPITIFCHAESIYQLRLHYKLLIAYLYSKIQNYT